MGYLENLNAYNELLGKTATNNKELIAYLYEAICLLACNSDKLTEIEVKELSRVLQDILQLAKRYYSIKEL